MRIDAPSYRNYYSQWSPKTQRYSVMWLDPASSDRVPRCVLDISTFEVVDDAVSCAYVIADPLLAPPDLAELIAHTTLLHHLDIPLDGVADTSELGLAAMELHDLTTSERRRVLLA